MIRKASTFEPALGLNLRVTFYRQRLHTFTRAEDSRVYKY